MLWRKAKRKHAMSIGITTPDLFEFSGLVSSDIPRVVRFAYQVAQHVGQSVYVLAMEVEGRRIAGPPLEGPAEGAVVRLGRVDAACVDWLGVGDDIVLWRPTSEQWASELIGRHWERDRQAGWGILVDARDTEAVVINLQAVLPRRRGGDDLARLYSSVGPERPLAMLSHDGIFFLGKAAGECWDIVLGLLKEISGGQLEVYTDDPVPAP
jgi:hypothetical protein